MTARLLDLAPAAWQAYQRLRAGEIGSRLKQALEQLADDPAIVLVAPRSNRCLVIEKELRQALQVWGLPVNAPDGARWLVVWRETAHVIEVGYIGPCQAGRRLLQKLKAGVPEDTLARMDAARGDDTRSAWLLQLRNAAECHARTSGIELSISP